MKNEIAMLISFILGGITALIVVEKDFQRKCQRCKYREGKQ